MKKATILSALGAASLLLVTGCAAVSKDDGLTPQMKMQQCPHHEQMHGPKGHSHDEHHKGDGHSHK
ncbi:MAG: hypothetical protein HYT93_02625 [Parcubacteria group bacterium]|nr:hypothetical protein [Parcubacteria group bacterium]